MENKNNSRPSLSLSSEKTKRLIFYCIMMALPILHVVVFYFYINIGSFTLAFKTLNVETGGYEFAGFSNFLDVFAEFKKEEYMTLMVQNSALFFVLSLFIGSAFSVIFSYYIYKKNIFHGFFKIILYMPNIISGLVFVLLFKYFADVAIPEIWFQISGKNIIGLVSNHDTAKITIMIYSCWVGFGTNVLLYTSAMSGISDSVIESAQLDGITPFKELISIVLPSIWPTFVTFMLLQIVGFFTNQINLFSFFGSEAERYLYSIGYYLYRSTYTFTTGQYPYLSAFGLLLTLVAVPLTLLVRYLLNKFGPKTY